MTNPPPLPALPQKLRSMLCTKCGYSNPETEATANAPCENSNCQYFAFVTERDYTADQMREYAESAIAALGSSMPSGEALTDDEIRRAFMSTPAASLHSFAAGVLFAEKRRAALATQPTAAVQGGLTFERWFHGVEGEVLGYKHFNGSYDDESQEVAARSAWAAALSANAGSQQGEPAGWRDALQFYADKSHFTMHQPDAWDTVSGEPSNFYEDESCTATVENGSVAKMALAGAPIAEADATPKEAGSQQSAYSCAQCGAALRAGYTCDVCDSDEAEPDDELRTGELSPDYLKGFEDGQNTIRPTAAGAVPTLRKVQRFLADRGVYLADATTREMLALAAPADGKGAAS